MDFLRWSRLRLEFTVKICRALQKIQDLIKCRTLNSTGNQWDFNSIRSLVYKLKWTTICFMQIEDCIVQNYRENCWIRHRNSLGKKLFFLAVAETVVAGKRCNHWTPLMSILLALQHIKPHISQKWVKHKSGVEEEWLNLKQSHLICQ